MARLTRPREDGAGYRVDDAQITHDAGGYSGEAIERLARFENAQADLLAHQETIALEMDRLRAEGKEKSVRFRELLSQKMINNTLIALLERYDLR
ncbi:MAG: hypothetical protein AAGU78_05020 [Chloroflexota bacterium]